MKNLFLPYSIANELKEKGFNEECLTKYGETSKKLYDITKYGKNSDDYEDFTTAPLYQQVIDWFREKHNMEVQAASWKEAGTVIYIYSVHNIVTQESRYKLDDDKKFITYHEALDAAIEEALKLISE